MALYLHCAICSRKQAEGLLSGAAWGRVELPAGADVEHPAVKGSMACACPTCVGEHADWPSRALRSLELGGSYGPTLPASA